jgi:hypothetical protein
MVLVTHEGEHDINLVRHPLFPTSVGIFSGSPVVSGVFRLPLEFGISSNSVYRHDGLPGIPVPTGTDVALRVSQVSANGLSIAGGFLILYKALDKP